MADDPARSADTQGAPASAASSAAAPGLSWSQRLAARIEGGVCSVGEHRETRARKVQFTIAAMIVVPAAVLWGTLYLLAGEPAAAAIPMTYAAVSLAGIVVLLRTGRFERFRLTQQVAIFVLPIALHLVLGGFVGSSGVIMWSFLAVLMAVLFGGAGPSRAWFAAFVIALIAVALAQPGLAVENRLPRSMVITFFALNIATVGGIVFIVLHSFLADRRNLRKLEVAYLEQEMALRQSEKLASPPTHRTLALGREAIRIAVRGHTGGTATRCPHSRNGASLAKREQHLPAHGLACGGARG